MKIMENQLVQVEQLFKDKKPQLAETQIDSFFQMGLKVKLSSEFFMNIIAYECVKKRNVKSEKLGGGVYYERDLLFTWSIDDEFACHMLPEAD